MQTRQIARYTLDGSYYGDWVTVKMPEKIQIVRCSFIARSGLVQRAPTKFRLYGSNDGSTWALIHNQAAALPYSGDIGRVDISTQTEYNHFGLVVSELSATGPSNDVLNFLQWDIYAVKVVCLCLRWITVCIYHIHGILHTSCVGYRKGHIGVHLGQYQDYLLWCSQFKQSLFVFLCVKAFIFLASKALNVWLVTLTSKLMHPSLADMHQPDILRHHHGWLWAMSPRHVSGQFKWRNSTVLFICKEICRLVYVYVYICILVYMYAHTKRSLDKVMSVTCFCIHEVPHTHNIYIYVYIYACMPEVGKYIIRQAYKICMPERSGVAKAQHAAIHACNQHTLCKSHSCVQPTYFM